MGRSPLLESFDVAGPLFGPDAAPVPSADWRDGHAQGVIDGRATAAAEQSALSAEIAQTLSDMAFGYAEARAHLLTALGPLFAALINHILPGTAEVAQAGQIIALLNAAAEQDSAAPLELTVHPGRTADLSALLPYAVGLPIMLVADPAIGPDQAILRSGRGETVLDIGAVISGAKAALAAIFETADQGVSYG
jgi:hypothetical protein